MTDKPADIEALMDEGVQEFDLERLAEQDVEPTAEDLRTLLGDEAGDASDEQLLTAYAAAEADKEPVAEPAAEPASEAAPVEPAAEPVAEVAPTAEPAAEAEPDAVSELLDKEITFNMEGGERTAKVSEILRLAQRADHNERRYQTAIGQRNSSDGQLQQAETELTGLRTDKKFWERVLSDRSGNLFQQAQQKWDEAVLRGDDDPAAAGTPATPPPGFTPEQDAAGERVFAQYIAPSLQAMALSYSPDGNTPTPELASHTLGQLNQQARQLIASEGRFITPERVQEILAIDLPSALQAGTYRPVNGVGAPAADSRDTEISSLKAKLANAITDRQKAKLEGAPDAPEGGSTPGATAAGPDMSGVKSVDDIRNMLADPSETFGM